MPRTIAATCLVAIIAVLSPGRSDACRCSPQPLESYYAAADIVLLAEILTVTIVATGDDGDAAYRSAEFLPLESIKGAAGLHRIRTPVSGAACGIAMTPGERYWVFAQRRPGEHNAWIHSCNGSRHATDSFVDVAPDQIAARLQQLAAAEAATAPAPLTPPECWKAPRTYHVGDLSADIAQKITVDRIEKTDAELAGRRSPNNAYAFTVQDPPVAGRPPRTATLVADVERSDLVRLRLHDVAAPLAASWINEKLILVRVTWDRQSFTDLILDVESAKLIYGEAARSGERLFEENRGPCVVR